MVSCFNVCQCLFFYNLGISDFQSLIFALYMQCCTSVMISLAIRVWFEPELAEKKNNISTFCIRDFLSMCSIKLISNTLR